MNNKNETAVANDTDGAEPVQDEANAKQSSSSSELTKALTKAGLGEYAAAFDQQEYKILKDLGDTEDDVKKAIDGIEVVKPGAVRRILRLWSDATTEKPKHEPIEAPEIPDGKPLDLTHESIEIEEVKFKLPTHLEAPSNNCPVRLATDLDKPEWLAIAKNNLLLYALDLEKAFSSKSDLEEPKARQAAALWRFPDQEGIHFFEVNDSATSNTTMSYTKSRQNLIHSRVTEAAVEVSAPFVGASAKVSHEEKHARSRETRTLYMNGIWWVPRAVVHLDQCLVAADRFEDAITNALEKDDDDFRFQALMEVFEKYGHVFPRTVILGGMMYFQKESKVTASQDEDEQKSEVAASVKGAYGPISGGVSANHKDGSQEGHGRQDSSERVTWTTVGGDTTLNERISDWANSVKDPRLWRVVQREDLMPITDLLTEQLRKEVKQVWDKGLKKLWAGETPPIGHVFPPFLGRPFLIAGGEETSSPVISAKLRPGAPGISDPEPLPLIKHGMEDPFAEECVWQLVYTGETTSDGDPLFWIIKFEPGNADAIACGELKDIRVPVMMWRAESEHQPPYLGIGALDEAVIKDWPQAKWRIRPDARKGKDHYRITSKDGFHMLAIQNAAPITLHGIFSTPVFCKALTRPCEQRSLVPKWHQSQLKKGAHFKGLEMYTLQGNRFEYTDGLETFADRFWSDASYYTTIRAVAVGDRLYALGRSFAGVEIYERRKNESWTINLGTCRRFEDPSPGKTGWTSREYYSTIQAAVVNGKLHLLGRGAGGVELYRWDEDDRWSGNLGTCRRFADPSPGKTGWTSPQYYSTIQTAVVGGKLHLLGRGAGGVELYRWDDDRWSGNLGTCRRFADPSPGNTGWSSREYYSTMQKAVVNGKLHLLGRGASGVELYRWDGNRWSRNLGTCESFSDAKGWGDTKHPHAKHEYYSTIQTAVVHDTLYLLGRSVKGVVLFRWEGKRWSENLASETLPMTDSGGWNKPDHYSTIQTAVIDDNLYLLGRGACGVVMYRWDDKQWKDMKISLEGSHKNTAGSSANPDRSLQTVTLDGELVLLGLTPQ